MPRPSTWPWLSCSTVSLRGVATNVEHGVVNYSPSPEDQQRMRARLSSEQDVLVRQGRMDADFVARIGARLAELQ